MSDIKFNTIEEAIADFKAGKRVIAVAVSYTHLNLGRRCYLSHCGCFML